MNAFSFSPIGTIHSCFKEKFGIPRQSGLIREATAELHLDQQFEEESVRGLEGFSHIWIQFIFHATLEKGWKTMVRPPRLGGNKKVGVFSTRSPFRPNPIGLSVVALQHIEISKNGIILHITGGDFLDNTPVLDIKPYLSYADSIDNSLGGFAQNSPNTQIEVTFSTEALYQCRRIEDKLDKELVNFITKILQQDPRPAYQKIFGQNHRTYSMKLYDFDLKWLFVENNKIRVLELV